ncbi:MAG TPA: methyl-accepting chemotaxis protein [Zoogloea sp.]|uniref:methyl-accepting chemotaxis protein n=1 Tax=Zoogloea sp. TaxID=49181 RepID=UPI002CE41931|nr:methyl-accepting chemotaxis protein [Zoogloea sp.]HMW50616.1 methyl-accepting chemotaxis protein [Rhodocyclaceae bacterium]HMY48785.1 methyl-accepting chemotaxis protein [Rhodocyclaceae bacterium]HNC80244.1 methyl-accepting chemotaxis protein [Rhodocyclaceae bacterium]HND23582.1 methyl-accepting chemotaxis protein [Rhodocyclaceae bacterium]HNF61114.1 methyl-accepting chemotaxis protein [Rhodocyclaceae bacterium]
MSRLNRLSLVHQIALAAGLISLIVFGTLVTFTTYFAEKADLAKTGDELGHQIQGVVRMLELNHAGAVARAGSSLGRVQRALGPLRIGPDTMASGSYQVPVVRSGERILNGNKALLETLRDQIDADPAVLLRVGDEFVRAATLLRDKDGKSTEGTPLPRDGKETRALLEGKSYRGVVRRNGTFFISAIDPMRDADGKVIGALAARVDIQSDMARLFAVLGETRSGATGYTYVIAPGADAATSEVVFHPTLSGKKLNELNNPVLSRVVGEQIRLGKGTLTYDWPANGGGEKTKMVAFDTAPSWGWIVATGSFVDEYTVHARELLRVLILLCTAGAALLVAVLYLIARSRIAPIRELVAVTERIGRGELNVAFPAVPDPTRNEVELITRALDSTTRQMAGLIGGVTHTANAIKGAAHSLRADSESIVTSTARQSESASGLAAAVEELSVSITHVSDSAALAREMTQDASAHADDGQHRMREMIDGMGRIAADMDTASAAVNSLSQRSARISNIGRIINDIADQTNLLALNAAIEAARAGESGRGFAVVADEVRKLAERTASSTREISETVTLVQDEAQRVVDTIQGITTGVQNGVAVATASGAMLETIRSESARTTGAVNDIADATLEQSSASQEVARNVEQIARMAEQNNQIIRDSHAQTTQLEQLADELEARVSHFRL